MIVLQLVELRYVELRLDDRWAGAHLGRHVRDRFRAGGDGLVVAPVRRFIYRAHPGRGRLRLTVVAATGTVGDAVVS